ncbi:hypothetical protein VP01_8410g1, partial [Puccinia sorghi]
KLGIPLRNTTKCEHQRAGRPFEEIHLDLIGPISPTLRENNRYILTVVDSNTRYCSATPINIKSNVFEVLSKILNYQSKRFGYYPSVLHSDRGHKFINSTMKDYCKDLLINCLSTLNLNQIPSHKSNKSPYELFKGKSLPLDFFHPIGNPVSFLNEPKNPGSKLYPKGSKGRLIGYNEEHAILSDSCGRWENHRHKECAIFVL